MSLTGADPMLKGAVMILKTADQHDLWKLRVADACWAATGKDVFSVDDDDCDTAILGLESPDAEERKLYEWLNKCWLIVRNSLHDDLYRRVSHVKRGMLESLFTEIGHALVVTNLEEVPQLRLELYGASMQKDGNNDLQRWINYLMERSSKLQFMGHAVPEPEMVAIFLKGLHPTVFQQLQVYFAIPGNLPSSFDAAAAIVRTFAGAL